MNFEFYLKLFNLKLNTVDVIEVLDYKKRNLSYISQKLENI